MIKILVPLIALAAGLGAGAGAGLFLAPPPATKEAAADVKPGEPPNKSGKNNEIEDKTEKSDKGSPEYLKLTKQFVIPVVDADEIAAMVTMSLGLEADPALTDSFYAIEPKLRDGFLQVLFDHANTGGFDGAFTQSDNLATLRKSLLEVARRDLGDGVSQVLIMSVSRQDI